MDGFPEHVFGCGDDPLCENCGERRDHLERTVRPCLASESLRAKFWHDGVVQYGLRPFGSTEKPMPLPEPPKKAKKPTVPTLF